jgi:hypothetical protein
LVDMVMDGDSPTWHNPDDYPEFSSGFIFITIQQLLGEQNG